MKERVVNNPSKETPRRFNNNRVSGHDITGIASRALLPSKFIVALQFTAMLPSLYFVGRR